MFHMPLPKKIKLYLVVCVAACLVLPGSAFPAGAKKQKDKRDNKGMVYNFRWREDGSGIGEARIPVRKGAPLYTVSVYNTMGRFCCETISVSAPDNNKTVYDSEWYGLAGVVLLVDLDGNGTAEIMQNINSFHEYDGMTPCYSPVVDAIFAYDPKQSRYVLANSRFPEYWQDTLNEARSKRPPAQPVPAMEPSEPGGGVDLAATWVIEGQVVARAVNLILAGYEKEAYIWFERQYKAPDEGKRAVKILREHMRRWHEDHLLPSKKRTDRPTDLGKFTR